MFEASRQLPLEQHAAVADWSPDARLTLWSSTQTPHYVHRALAQVLSLAPARIRVIACPNGAGFGGESVACSHAIVFAKFPTVTGRPGTIPLSPQEEVSSHC